MENLTAQIERLLSEPLATAAEREQTTFDGWCREAGGAVVLFGAGRLGRLCARGLKQGGVPVCAFCDTNPGLHGTIVEEIEVLSVAEAARQFGDSALFVVTIWTGTAREGMGERISLLRGMGCKHVGSYAPLVWAYGKNEVPFHAFDLPTRILSEAEKIRRLAGLLGDDESLQTLLAALQQRLRGEFRSSCPASEQYFPSELVRLTPNEIVADGGAFDGDTLEDFLQRTAGRFDAYHAFEPDPVNANKLRQKIAHLSQPVRGRIWVHEIALHSRDVNLSFAGQGGQTSHLTAGGGASVQGATLDRVLRGQPVTFLKLDIEGAELDALKGARELLAEQCPMVAACIYHAPADLWEIPLLLKKQLSDSKFFLRMHGFDGWETVCYAIPPARNIRISTYGLDA